MLTDEERQAEYAKRWKLLERAGVEYWQSMWEKSMHNPKNQPAAHHGDVDEYTHPTNPSNPCPPRTAWSKDPWPDVKGTQCPPASEASFSDKDLSILTEAHGLVYGARQRAYGHPAVDFSRTAALISILLASKLSRDLGPEDVAMIMVCVKLSREANEHGRDNLVDAAGYLECLSRVKRFTGSVEGK